MLKLRVIPATNKSLVFKVSPCGKVSAVLHDLFYGFVTVMNADWLDVSASP
jgi:hypothetical protein